jgi:hypothetical protein
MTGNGLARRLPYTEAQVTAWLAWLAHRMQHYGQTVFQLEQLEPSWLLTRRERQIFIVATRLVWGMVTALSFLLILGVSLGIDVMLSNGVVIVVPAPGLSEMKNVASAWLPTALVYGLVGGLVGGLIDSWHFERRDQKTGRRGQSRFRQTITGFTSAFLVYGALGGLIYGLIVGFDKEMSDGTKQWLGVGLIFGIVFGLIRTTRGTLREANNVIQPIEMLQWSWASARRAGLRGLILGLMIGLTFGLIFGQVNGLVFIPVFGLAGGLIGGFLIALIGGFKPGIREMKTIPNQGIRLSLYYAIRSGILAGLMMGIPLTLITRDLGLGLAYGLLTGIALSMYFGGLEVIEHGILRAILAAKGYAPLNYVRFLDYAADELNFLQKVGGGYIFIHRYLLEYFAALEVTKLPGPADTLQALGSSS